MRNFDLDLSRRAFITESRLFNYEGQHILLNFLNMQICCSFITVLLCMWCSVICTKIRNNYHYILTLLHFKIIVFFFLLEMWLLTGSVLTAKWFNSYKLVFVLFILYIGGKYWLACGRFKVFIIFLLLWFLLLHFAYHYISMQIWNIFIRRGVLPFFIFRARRWRYWRKWITIGMFQAFSCWYQCHEYGWFVSTVGSQVAGVGQQLGHA